MKIHTINELTNIRGKYVLLRDDFNVQIVDGKITDPFRIEQSMPTINRLREMGARIAIVAHWGRPNGMRDMKYSLKPIAEFMNVKLIPDVLDKDFLKTMSDGDIVLMENVRFYKGEEKNDLDFAQKLADGFDIYVNDAFSVSHRAHASTVGVTKFLPSYAGELLSNEIEQLSNVMENPKRPLLAIIGGAKIASKLPVIKSLIKISDKIIIGGAISNTMMCARGINVGKSMCEIEMLDIARDIMELAEKSGCEIITPIDKGTAKEFAPNAPRENRDFRQINDDDIILDEGEQSLRLYEDTIDSVDTVLWNGTIGMAEWPAYSVGSFTIAKYIALRTKMGKLVSIVGGGDTVAALEATDTKDNMTYVSTGGGAFLEFIEGCELPGIKSLEIKV